MHRTLLLALAFCLPSLALADAIGPPPEKCPPGAIGESSHEGEWCQPSTCTIDCPEGRKCRPGVGLCVTSTEVPCGGLYPVEMEPCTTTIIEAHGPCAADSDCAKGTCEVARRCIRTSTLSRVGKGCGCAVEETPSGLGAALLLGLGLLLRSRRR